MIVFISGLFSSTGGSVLSRYSIAALLVCCCVFSFAVAATATFLRVVFLGAAVLDTPEADFEELPVAFFLIAKFFLITAFFLVADFSGVAFFVDVFLAAGFLFVTVFFVTVFFTGALLLSFLLQV